VSAVRLNEGLNRRRDAAEDGQSWNLDCGMRGSGVPDAVCRWGKNDRLPRHEMVTG